MMMRRRKVRMMRREVVVRRRKVVMRRKVMMMLWRMRDLGPSMSGSVSRLLEGKLIITIISSMAIMITKLIP